MIERMQITTRSSALSFITSSGIYLLAILVNIDLREPALIVSLIKTVKRIKWKGVAIMIAISFARDLEIGRVN